MTILDKDIQIGHFRILQFFSSKTNILNKLLKIESIFEVYYIAHNASLILQQYQRYT